MTAPARPRTLAANQARQQGTRVKLELVEEALCQMRRERTPVTYPAVARRVGVSRTFLYQNPDARKLMATAVAAADDGRRRAQAGQDGQAQMAWRQRALNAEDALKAAYAEIGTQRQRIAILMGQVRELQAEYTVGTAQRITAENTTLKQRVRQLADDKHSLEDKLQAARSNNRFLDKRIAALEASLLDAPLAVVSPVPRDGASQ